MRKGNLIVNLSLRPSWCVSKVDIVVVAGGDTVTEAAQNATKTIPIVVTGSGSDPVGKGFVESLARPGGNVTGLTNLPGARR